MKDDNKKLVVSVIVSIVIVSFILFLNYLTNGSNLIISQLVQGEVLAGIAIALPTLLTWNNSINEKRENKKDTVSDNVRDAVKYYDKQLFEIVENISKDNQLPFHKAEKIEYIIDTYNSLLKEWNEKSRLTISLDFVQVLSAICSIKYPDGIENPGNEEVENWKYNLGTALKPTMREVIAQNKQVVLSSTEIKYFSYVEFGSEGYLFENVQFKDKHFVQCTFSADFLKFNKFENCIFINCSISNGELSEEDNKILLNNTILGTFKDVNEEELTNSEELVTGSSTDSKKKATMLEHGRVFDAREGIKADDYIIDNRFFKIQSNSVTRKEIYKDIVRSLNSYGLDIDEKINNKKISISKNYMTEDNKLDFIEGSLFSGWHSLFADKIGKSNNFSYYIFCVRDNTMYNTIVFKKSEFDKFLNKKIIDKTGKYNFYFNGFELE